MYYLRFSYEGTTILSAESQRYPTVGDNYGIHGRLYTVEKIATMYDETASTSKYGTLGDVIVWLK